MEDTISECFIFKDRKWQLIQRGQPQTLT